MIDPEVQDKQAVTKEYAKFQRPIPGQSLTNDPENPAPYERPPQFTNLKKAQEYVFEGLISEEVFVPMMELLDNDEATIMELTQNVLYAGFRKGKWNPDLMLMLAEPTAYMFMALAERAGIEYRVDDEPDEEEETLNEITSPKAAIRSKAPESKEIPKGALPTDIEQKIEDTPVESLLSKSEAPEEVLEGEEGVAMDEEESLLG